MNNEFLDVEKIVGYTFLNKGLLRTALTHQSFANESGYPSYERLEFLGDAVLELVVSEYIYDNFTFDSGVSSKLRASLVSTEYLSQIVKELDIQKYVFVILKTENLKMMILVFCTKYL